jgi:hypothetical protein
MNFFNKDSFKFSTNKNAGSACNKNLFTSYMHKHPYHMVKNSPWPFVTAQALFIFILALVNFFHYTKNSELAVIFSFIVFLLPIFFWFRDIVRESTYMGLYTLAVQKNLRIGMLLFIVSEAMFFFSLF